MKFCIEEEHKTCSGIYLIQVRGGSKSYVGQTINFYNRFGSHKSLLRKSKHPCGPLQSAYSKHGENSFSFKLLELCPKEDLTENEQKWMDQFGCDNLYNVCPAANSTLGLKRPIDVSIRQSINQGGLGHPGVKVCKVTGKFKAHVYSNRKRVQIGVFDTLDSAKLAIEKFESTGCIQRPLKRTNTSGYEGVWFNKINKTWVVSVTIDGKQQQVGSYATKELACDKRKLFLESGSREIKRELSRLNTSGYKGVTLDKESGKWMAKVTYKKKRMNIGRFETPELANSRRMEFIELLNEMSK